MDSPVARSGAPTRRRLLGTIAAGAGSMALARYSLRARAGASAAFIEPICKPAWGAQPPKGEFVTHRIERLTVHHSAVILHRNRDAPGEFRSHQAYHQSRGWPDIAYHMLIDRRGNVYRGRPSSARGDTGTTYDPTGHYLVLCEGNFSEQPISKAQVRALVDVLAWASGRFDVPPRRIHGHRDFAATACPGTDLYRLIDSGVIERRVGDKLATGGVKKKELCGRAGRRRVAAIESGNA